MKVVKVIPVGHSMGEVITNKNATGKLAEDGTLIISSDTTPPVEVGRFQSGAQWWTEETP